MMIYNTPFILSFFIKLIGHRINLTTLAIFVFDSVLPLLGAENVHIDSVAVMTSSNYTPVSHADC